VRPATPQDAALAQAIQARLQQGSNGPWGRVAGNVGVEVANGAVRLTGKLTTAQHRQAIESVVRGTRGVRSVTNAVTVGP
jgi:osmotically-inducible protein OsmY